MATTKCMPKVTIVWRFHCIDTADTICHSRFRGPHVGLDYFNPSVHLIIGSGSLYDEWLCNGIQCYTYDAMSVSYNGDVMMRQCYSDVLLLQWCENECCQNLQTHGLSEWYEVQMDGQMWQRWLVQHRNTVGKNITMVTTEGTCTPQHNTNTLLIVILWHTLTARKITYNI